MLDLLARLREFLTTIKTARKMDRNARLARIATTATKVFESWVDVPSWLVDDASPLGPERLVVIVTVRGLVRLSEVCADGVGLKEEVLVELPVELTEVEGNDELCVEAKVDVVPSDEVTNEDVLLEV